MSHHHHSITPAVALTLALTLALAPAAPAAWADPAPLARAEATIAANSRSSTTARPNPDEQTVTGATANPGPCSETCSGGAGSYGSVSQRSSTPDESGATLPHDSRPRWLAASSHYNTASTAPKTVRGITHSGGFRWGDAGIGAGGMLALALIGLIGALAATRPNSASATSTRADQR